MHDVVQRFDPGEPRDDRGRWTDGGGSDSGGSSSPTSFISPNTGTLSFTEAVAALDSDRQKKIADASAHIDAALGIKSTNYPAIGAWADGAENSIMVVAPGASLAQIRAASAMKGYVADQKAVLVFNPSHTGNNFLASFDVTGKAADLHDTLLKAGLSFHTLQPVGADHFRVHVFGQCSDKATIDAIDKASAKFDAIPEFGRGDGEFIGTTKEDGTDREQRDDARKQYERVIHEVAVSGAVEGQNVGDVWNEVRDHWAKPEGGGQGQSRQSSGGRQRASLAGVVDAKPKDFAQMTMRDASRILPPTLFKRYYVAACEFFDANTHLARANFDNLVVVVRSAPLYVHRDLENVDDVVSWAKAQGFDEVNDDLHVTVLYSKTPVDWDDMGDRDTGTLVVPAGGERTLEVLGDDAVALVFASTALARRHGEMLGEGASSDYDAYVPHVTINTSGTIPDGAVPYDGELVFGPEMFETIDTEKAWTDKFWDESKHPRVPGGSPEGGEFDAGGGGDSGETSSGPIEAPEKIEAKVAASVKEDAELARSRGLEALAGSQSEHPDTIASRQPTGKGAAKGSYGQPSVAAMKLDEGAFEHNVGLFRNADFYPNFRPGELTGNADKDARTIVDHFKNNLLFLYRQATDKNESKLWYDGARMIVDNRARRYGFNDASVAAVYASLSPNKDWDQNVYLGDEMLHIYGTRQDQTWDKQMDATAKKIWNKPKWKPMLALVAGKTLRELDTPEKKAFWIRTYNEAHSARFYRAVRPDGSQGAYVRTARDQHAHAAWQTVANIANAVKAIEADGDRDKISDAMGAKHKVRSFFNNILDPHSGNGDVTIDTHAVGAALLRPLHGDAVAVHHNFGTYANASEKPKGFEGTQNSKVTGNVGTYGLYAEAYREVAHELGIEPRQLQSITWVAKRNLFDRGLTDEETADIDAAWREYHDDPSMKLADVQKRVVKIAGGFQNAKMLEWSWPVAA
jgi:hypothetical protein